MRKGTAMRQMIPAAKKPGASLADSEKSAQNPTSNAMSVESVTKKIWKCLIDISSIGYVTLLEKGAVNNGIPIGEESQKRQPQREDYREQQKSVDDSPLIVQVHEYEDHQG